MPVKVSPLLSRDQSGRAIYRQAKNFGDLKGGLETTLRDWFDFVKALPYEENPPGTEIVKRPAFVLREQETPIDCKQKAVLMGAWLEAHGIPWRLAAVSERKDKQIHHVMIQAKIEGRWKNIDATYSDFELFEPKRNVTYAEELPR